MSSAARVIPTGGVVAWLRSRPGKVTMHFPPLRSPSRHTGTGTAASSAGAGGGVPYSGRFAFCQAIPPRRKVFTGGLGPVVAFLVSEADWAFLDGI